MARAIITIYSSKCAQMDPQQLLKRSKFCLGVFPFLFYPPFFLPLFLFEVSPLSLYAPSSSVVSFLLSLKGIFHLLPVLKPPHLICALSNRSSPSYDTATFQRLPVL